MESLSCVNCGETRCLSKCGNCGIAIYCSRDCQLKDWSDHKDFCADLGEYDDDDFSDEEIEELLQGLDNDDDDELVILSRGRKRRYPSARKARKILRHGKIRGKRLTKKQRRFFGWIAGGRKPRSRRRRRRRRRRRKHKK